MSTFCRISFTSATIQVDEETHQRLLQLSTESGISLIETVKQAAEALRRQRFAQQVTQELETLRSDEEAWDGYLGEAASTSVTDGLT